MEKANGKQWTVMVYFAADNDLDEFAPNNLKQMKKAGSTADVNLIAEVDNRGDKPPKRYYLRSENESTLEADELPIVLPERNTGDPKHLIEFIQWGSTYAAERYALVLWGHGQGWDDDVDCILKALKSMTDETNPGATFFGIPVIRPAAEKIEGIGGDLTSKDFLDNSELQFALSEGAKRLGQKIDLFGMDACLMNMAEVAYQVRESVRFVVGSEDLSPNEGWPYDLILTKLVSSPKLGAEDFARIVVAEYVEFYKKKKEETDDKKKLKRDVMLSACDLSKSEEVADGIERLCIALARGLPDLRTKAAIMLARRVSRSYFVKDYIDLCNFCENLSAILPKLSSDTAIVEACKEVIGVIRDRRFVIASGSTEAQVTGAPVLSNGVSFYFPWIPPSYNDLGLVRKTQWHEFLDRYLNESLFTKWSVLRDQPRGKERATVMSEDRYPIEGSRLLELILDVLGEVRKPSPKNEVAGNDGGSKYPIEGSRLLELILDILGELPRPSERNAFAGIGSGHRYPIEGSRLLEFILDVLGELPRPSQRNVSAGTGSGSRYPIEGSRLLEFILDILGELRRPSQRNVSAGNGSGDRYPIEGSRLLEFILDILGDLRLSTRRTSRASKSDGELVFDIRVAVRHD